MSHRSLRRASAALASLGLAAALVVGTAAPASAHDALQSSSPAAGATVTEPLDAVTLTYADDLLALGGETSGFAIQVIDVADQSHHQDGCVSIDGATASATVALEPGTYQVLWQVVSGDGHPISGEYQFVYAPSAPTDGVQTVTTAPTCGGEWAGSAPAPTETDAADDGSGSTPAATQAPDPEPGAGSEAGGASAETETEDAASDVDIPLGAIVIGGLGILAAAALVIVLAMRRMKDQP